MSGRKETLPHSKSDTRAKLPVVAVLGDSRAFDTYYVNDAYPDEARYGYDKTFPHLLGKLALSDKSARYDVVHIPDHFRGGTVENNIIRLALTDPTAVVLCDGIWETLVHKDWYIEWISTKIRAHPTLAEKPLAHSFSSRTLADLFIADELPVSPKKYAAKQRRLISYFRRRRRQCIWLSLTTPPREHLEGLHYAGNYRCIPEWRECLQAVNLAMRPIVDLYDAHWLDLDELVAEHGGYADALIDQWHFSKRFHEAIASVLAHRLPSILEPESHPSSDFMLARSLAGRPAAIFGTAELVDNWRRENPQVELAGVLLDEGAVSSGADIPVVRFDDFARLNIRCVLLADGENTPLATEVALIKQLPQSVVLLYPSEVGPIKNPAISDRFQHGRIQN